MSSEPVVISDNGSDNGSDSGGGGRGCLRILFVSFFWAVILVAVAVGGYWLYLELNRSFGSVNTRVDANQQRLERLDAELASLAAGDPQQDRNLSALATAVSRVDSDLGSLATDLAAQTALLATVEARLAAVDGAAGQALDETGMLTERMATQEFYLGANATAVGTVALNVQSLDGTLNRLRATQEANDAAELTQLQQTLALFRTWELITRARLRLLENNIGLATDDIRSAQETLAFVTRTMPPAEGTLLEQVQARLALAQTALPDDPETALGDLENAWDSLDRLLVVIILQAEPDELIMATTTPTAPTPESGETPEAETTATVTPAVTPTPSAAVSPTPTPES